MNILNGFKLIFRALIEMKPSVNCYSESSESEKWYLYTNMRDQRGRSLILNGLSQPNLSRVWRAGIRHFSPHLVIDVGANYGEFGLGVKYADTTKVLLVEANPTLNRFLKKTIKSHPNADQIELAEILACGQEKEGEELELFVDSRWSGYSSVIVPEDYQGRGKLIKCPCETVDSFVDDIKCNTLAFKIDVEGYEFQVIEGMRKVLDRTQEIFGLIEFNKSSLTAAGCDPNKFVEELQAIGDLYRVSNSGSATSLLRVKSVTDVPDGKEDLVICNTPSFIKLVGEEIA